jgi:uncharacterized protein YdaL
VPAGAAPGGNGKGNAKGLQKSHEHADLPALVSPPTPPRGRPVLPKKQAGGVNAKAATGTAATGAAVTRTAATGLAATALAAAAPTPPASARSFGATGAATTLVLYDKTGAYGWLGELYALASGNLASHFGRITAQPAVDYVAGQVEQYTATIYMGSTYNEPLPASLLADVRTTSKPVLWSGFNIWQLSGASGSAENQAFQARYGWDPATSYIDTTDTLATVRYKGRSLTRSANNTGGLLSPHLTTPEAVSVLAAADCTRDGASVPCDGIAQTNGGSTMPWAVRSANLTYTGEIPFSYLSENDRYLVFADLLFAALAPGATESHRAAVRLEDVSPASDPAELRAVADYLASEKVPFTVSVIPKYSDPKGTYNGGVAESITLAQAPAVVSALKYMVSKGGTLLQHGFTHQYKSVSNPYNGVTGDDFEFYRSRCSSTNTAPYTFHDPCPITDYVILTGPVPEDSVAWASDRVTQGRALFGRAGLPTPTIFETPHYASSAAGYAGMAKTYGTRYERELFFGGLLTGQASDKVFGQFFPYSVSDVYGTTMLPENIGDFSPELYNNHAPRLAADLVRSAEANLVVTQGVASFFYHPYYGVADLKTIVSGIKGLGYTFVPGSSLK